MNIFKQIYCRTFQMAFRIMLPLLPYREPTILKTNSDVVNTLGEQNKTNVFFVTDKNIRGLGLTNPLEEELIKNNINVTVFDEVMPNPTVSAVENAYAKYLENNCDSIIALGGGSVIDLAKTVGARVSHPNKSVNKMKGLLKLTKALPLFVAIPTTAGTGSETTLAAVITDDKTHHKYAINSFPLIPHYALLDYNLTLGLNKRITATTGLDALTHAIEAYIGRSTTKLTRQASLDSIKLIYENLETVCNDPKNKEARFNMLKASYLAGVAFTRSYVGYVHAVAHTLGGKYGVAHGFANAVILPVVLKKYGESAYEKLFEIAQHLNLTNDCDTTATGAYKVIAWIENLNKNFEIPTTIKELKEEDIEELSILADKEGNPLYPVPCLMDEKELQEIYKELLEK